MGKCHSFYYGVVLFYFFLSSAFAQQFNLVPEIPSTITNTNLAYFDILGRGTGAKVYSIQLMNEGNKRTTGLEFSFNVQFRSPGESQFVLLYEGVSNRFILDSNETMITVDSRAFLTRKNPEVKFSRYKSVSWKAEDAFRDELIKKVMEAGTLVTGTLRYEFSLSGPGIDQTQTLDFEIKNVSFVQPLQPGGEWNGSNFDIPLIFTQYPQFYWNTDLQSGIYGSGAVFRFELFEEKIGVAGADLLSRPFLSVELTQNQFNYPSSGAPPLEEGKIYLWRVTGLLQGAVDAELSSSVYAFKIQKNAQKDLRITQAIERLKALLRGSPFESVLDEIEGYDSAIRVQLSDDVQSLEALENWIVELTAGNYSLERLYVR